MQPNDWCYFEVALVLVAILAFSIFAITTNERPTTDPKGLIATSATYQIIP